MTTQPTTNPTTHHDREACRDCARARTALGDPTNHCGRTHDLREGQLVTVGSSTAPWTIEWAADTVVVVYRERMVNSTGYARRRRHRRTFGGGGRNRPLTDLHLVRGQ